jgi:lactoylglutathione lyase
MKFEHVAMWTQQLETMRAFDERYFNGRSHPKYTNLHIGFTSYFITFDDGLWVELMQRPDIPNFAGEVEQIGLAHLAMSVGSETDVDTLTDQLRLDDYQVISEPRTTGDGYYESVILDPDGNRIEITG